MKQQRSLGTRILYGVIAGVALGVFLGELAAPLGMIGKIYVGLLQMTVLPYVTISLITKIGGLEMGEAKRLGGQAGVIMLLLWAASLAVVFVLPFSLPAWEAGTFFSASLVEQPGELDFLGLYLPVNPFHSLANNVVPAAVLFSICVGLALIPLPGKQKILEPAETMSAALGRISNAVVLLSPYGTFAMTADAAGRLAPDELTRLAGYVSTNTLGVIFLTFIGLPALVAALSPFTFRGVLRGFKSAGLTAFATGKLFAVLPMVISSVKEQLMTQGMDEAEADSMANVYVPLGYPFPNAGKVLAILFIPFAAWYVGRPLDLTDYPALLSVGLLSVFGSPVAAIPFLLDMLRLPQDVFPLFLVAGIWSARFGDVLGAMHLTAFTLLCAGWSKNWLKFNPAKIGAMLAVTSVILLIFTAGNHFIVKAAMADQEPSRSLVEKLDLKDRLVEIRVDEVAAPNPEPLHDGEQLLERVGRTRTLRVGYRPHRPPFCFRNGAGDLVGLDIDIAQRLALYFNCALHLVPYGKGELAEAFGKDHFDVAVGGIRLSVESFIDYKLSAPYLEMHAALLVPDHDVRRMRGVNLFNARENVRLGYTAGGDLAKSNQYRFSGVELVEIESAEAYVRGEVPDLDGILMPAEIGAYVTMVFPQYSVIVPQGPQIRVPVSIAINMASRKRAERIMDTWIELRRLDGTMTELYDHWILGKDVQRKKRRWSVIQDVLGWVE